MKNTCLSQSVADKQGKDTHAPSQYYMTDKAGHMCRWKLLDKAMTLQASDYKDPPSILTERERERERVAYCIDRSAFNCGANAKFDMPIVAELCTTLRARGPNAVAVIREEE